ncbi:MAG: hypothetical protein ABI895_31435 [Deltaproteobacteria bacterium]
MRERADAELTFHPLPTPSAAEVADVARRTAKRLGRAFKAEGRPSPWDSLVDPREKVGAPIEERNSGLGQYDRVRCSLQQPCPRSLSSAAMERLTPRCVG